MGGGEWSSYSRYLAEFVARNSLLLGLYQMVKCAEYFHCRSNISCWQEGNLTVKIQANHHENKNLMLGSPHQQLHLGRDEEEGEVEEEEGGERRRGGRSRRG